MIAALYDKLKELKISIKSINGQLDVTAPEGVLNNEILGEIRNNKEDLISFIDSYKKKKKLYSEIAPVTTGSSYVLSSSQRRLWLLSQLEGGSKAYHMPGELHLEGEYKEEYFSKAIALAISRHEILRTVFRENEQGELGQVVLDEKELNFHFAYRDMEGEQEASVRRYLESQWLEEFDLSKGPLLRAGLIRVSPGHYIFHFCMHHIISDGWSMELLRKEVMAYYANYAKGLTPEVHLLRIQYKDYAHWQQEQLKGELMKEYRNYWLKQLSGELPVLSLPSYKQRPAVMTHQGHDLFTMISTGVVARLTAICQERQATLFMGLLGILNALLYRYTGQEDIIIGSPVAGRSHSDLEDQIGFYVNTLALRTQFNGAESFEKLLEKVREVTLGAYGHQTYPFDRLVEDLGVRRDMGRSPVSDIMLVLDNIQLQANGWSEYGQDAIHDGGACSVKLDLHISFSPQGNGLYMDVQYNSAVYDKATIVRLIEHYKRLLELVVTIPGTAINKYEYLSVEEQQQLLQTFNDTKHDYGGGVTLLDLFNKQVAARGEEIALQYKEKIIDYKTLDTLSTQLAGYLRKQHGVEAGGLVCVMLHRNEWLIISLLAVWKLGCAYVPVDPLYPAERAAFIQADSGCKICIDAELLNRFKEVREEYINDNYYLQLKEDDLVYVIYTSGSTGEPKGCMLQHRGVVNRLTWMWRQYGFTSEDVVLQKTTFTFDVSVWELFLPLCYGCKMVLCEDVDVYAADRIADLISNTGVTCVHFVPGMLDAFIENVWITGAFDKLAPLKRVITSGEALKPHTVNRWYSKMQVPVENLYGPTEASIDVTYFTTKAGLDRIPIGKPVSNTQLYILDKNRQLVPCGVEGELYIGGLQLARGYLNREALTNERFIPHPFLKDDKLYRTGDLARWLVDGNIEYLGRIDDQVKIRGYRIEPGEVEHALLQLPGITAACVHAWEDEGERYLAGYVVSEEEQRSVLLRQQLQERLPEYMIPSYFVQLNKLPVTANGKIDRRALPNPGSDGKNNGVAYVPPQNELEEKILLLWQEVLRTEEPISTNAGFFNTGGHSLRVMQLVNYYWRNFDVQVSVQELFTHTTISAHAALLANKKRVSYSDIEPVAKASDYVLSDGQRRLWLLSQLEGGSRAYHIPGELQMEGEYEAEHFSKAIELAISRHEILRTVFRENEENELRQVVLDEKDSKFEFVYKDMESENEEVVRQYLENQWLQVFDVSAGPLLRAGLIRLGADRYIFHFCMHHIISDGWSMELLRKEVMEYYESYVKGKTPTPDPLRIQYKDYACWQQAQVDGASMKADRSYWLNQLSGELPILSLPSYRQRPAVMTHQGYALYTMIGSNMVQQLTAICHQHQATLYMGLLAILNTLLHRYTGQQDIIIGSPVAGRNHAALENQIGFYVNTLALRSRFDGEDSFEQLLKKIKEVTLTAFSHQNYPFDRLVEDLEVRRDMSRTPVSDVMLVLNNMEANADGGANITQDSIHDGGACSVKMDLHISLSPYGNGLHMDVRYNSDVYDRDIIARFMEHYKRFIELVVASPSTAIGDYEYLSTGESDPLLHVFNDTPNQRVEENNSEIVYVAPQSELEKQVHQLWQQVLKTEKPVSIHADFFTIGGHSLRVMKLVNSYWQQLDIKVSVQELFTHKTIATQAALLAGKKQIQYIDIKPAAHSLDYILSYGQRRLWLLSQIENSSRAFHIPGELHLEGEYDPAHLNKAIELVISRHEILRTVFRENEQGELRQVVLDDAASTFRLAYRDMEGDREENIRQYLNDQWAQVFDLSNGPLIRAGLIRVRPDRHIFHFCLHHIISDGWSMELLHKEAMAYYDSYAKGDTPAPVPLRIQYKDYAHWQHEQAEDELVKEDRNYWLQQLSGELPVLSLPSYKPRPAVMTHQGHELFTVIDGEVMHRLTAMCQQRQATLFMGLLAILDALLYRYTAQKDIIINSPVAGRGHADLEDQLGFYVNTLALRTTLSGADSFEQLLNKIRDVTLSAYNHQSYPFDRLVEDLDIHRDMSRSPVSDITLVLQSQFDRYSKEGKIEVDNYGIIDAGNCAVKTDLHISFIEQADELYMDVQYNSDVYDKATITRFMEHYKKLIELVAASPSTAISDYKYLSTEEEDHLLQVFNDTTVVYAEALTVLDLFKNIAEQKGNEIAIRYGRVVLTYKELDELSTRVAVYLQEQYAIKANDIVAVKLPRSEWIVVVIMGILKSGAAYLPVDVNYPEAKQEYIINNSSCRRMIDEQELAIIKAITQSDLMSSGSGLPVAQPHQLAYVIYTSGSTGDPKGVMIGHRSLYNYLRYCQETYMPDADVKYIVPLFTSLAFDLTVPSLFGPLITGGEIVVYPQEETPADIMQDIFFGTRGINLVKCTPTHINLLKGAEIAAPGVQRIIVGGEELTHAHVSLLQSINNTIQIFNEYGPTEATVGCIVEAIPGKIGTAINTGNRIPIGKPLHNVQVYILDGCHNLLPAGVRGELYIGGVQLAQGYLNRADLTAERFIQHPYKSGERLYRSGDLARWLPDGRIEYLGRIDDQVKMRGYRIEPGEIEHALYGLNGITAACMQVMEDAEGEKYLVAYIVSDTLQDSVVLRQLLQDRLPQYMIPTSFVQLNALPMTVNGKIDKKALPDPRHATFRTAAPAVAARNDVEEKLLEIFENIFKRKEIGIRDNFFDLGGDSIKAILLASRLKQQGYSIKIGEILKYPTIEELAIRVNAVAGTEAAENVQGEVMLTPAQQWFLESEYPVKHHFNQSVLLLSKEGINAEWLKKVLHMLVAHHDALRMTFIQKEGQWHQYNRAADSAGLLFDLHEYNMAAENNPAEQMLMQCEQLQASINLQEGPLVKAAVFHLPDGDRILLIIHHLVIDGVSWRILLEDLSALYQQVIKNETAQLPAKSDSYRQWADCLQKYAGDKIMQDELPYWSSLVIRAANGPILKPDKNEQQTGWHQTKGFALDTLFTNMLLTKVSRVYRTEINDILLAALGKTVADCFHLPQVLIDMEGHGREEIIDNVNISRTVGWFTSLYPLLIDISAAENIAALLVKIKEQLRSIPNKGVGFGILRYLHAEGKDLLAPLRRADLTFNYLGDFGSGASSSGEESIFRYAKEYKGRDVSFENEQCRGLMVTGMIVEGRLQMTFGYNTGSFSSGIIDQLITSYEFNLKELIGILLNELMAGVQDEGNRHITPSDLTYKGLSIEEINALNEGGNIEDVYELSPLQEGIYYHWLTGTATSTYVIQSSYHVAGAIDVKMLEKSYQYLVRRHGILRSAFFHQYGSDNIQVVRSKGRPEFKHERCRDAGGNKTIWVEEYKERDRLEGFDLHKGNLMRLSVIDFGNDQYEFIWSHHHILMDGWSGNLLIKEFYNIYHDLVNNREPALSNITPYVNYIKWLAGLNTAATGTYWEDYLKNYEQLAQVPYKQLAQSLTEHTINQLSFALDSMLVQSLRKGCKEMGITENTFFQGCWAFMLSRYNNSRDVVFGSVVSGRPPEISGIENMIGVFSNTIPVRIKYEEDYTVKTFLLAIQQEAIHSLPHHYISLADVQSKNQYRQLFDNILVYENFPIQEVVSNGMGSQKGLDSVNVRSTGGYTESNYDFTVQIAPIRGGIQIGLIYREPVFNEEAVNRIREHFITVINGFVTGLNHTLSHIHLSGEQEQQLLLQWGLSQSAYPGEATIVQLFEEQVKKHPQETALVFEDQSFNWKELDEYTNRLCHYLLYKGVEPGDPIPLCMTNCADAIAGMLAILKAGAAYVPVDPSFPKERIHFILHDVKARLVISHHGFNELLSGATAEVLELDTLREVIGSQPCTNAGTNVLPESKMYIIYTSGSTGQPKGVMVSHRNMVDYLYGLKTKLPITFCRSFALVSGIHTDLGNTVLYSALSTGCCLHILSKDVVNNAIAIADYFETNRIDCLKIVPSHWQALSPGDTLLLPRRLLIFGGESLHAGLVQRINNAGAECMIVNHYGPTETTVGKLLHIINRENKYEDVVPVGRPFGNNKVYVLTEDRQLAPLGIPGELYIAGDGIAAGYWSNPVLTQQCFMPDPFANDGSVMYKTGDKVKYLPDGEIVFLKRIDSQVKIRGYRIEIAEIEKALGSVEGVTQAVVVVRTEGDQYDKTLVGYVTGTADHHLLMESLQARLPDYMVPAAIVKLDILPLTANGKIDRQELAARAIKGAENNDRRFMAPGNATEERLAVMWKDILGVDGPVGVQDDFFELGGHSIKAIKLLSRIAKEFGVVLGIQRIFERSTIEALANEITAQNKTAGLQQIPKAPEAASYPLSSSQKRLWVIHAINKNSVAYNMPTVLPLHGVLISQKYEQAIRSVVERHEILRTIFLEEDGELRQVVLPAALLDVKLECVDLRSYSRPNQHAREIINADIQIPFNLNTAPLFRIKLLQVAEEEYLLYLNMHHIISDGWSMNVLSGDVLKYYEAYVKGTAPDLKPLAIQYKDYAAWQQSQLSGELFEKHRSYWLLQLSGELPVLQVPTDKPRPPVLTDNGYELFTVIGYETTARFNAVCQGQQATLFMGLLSVLNTLLYRYTGQEDIIIGSPVAGREHADVEDQMGIYINTLPLRTRFTGASSFYALLANVREVTVNAYEHQLYPFDRLVEELDVRRDMSRSAVFDVMLMLQNQQDRKDWKGEINVPLGETIIDLGPCAVKCDLNIVFEEWNDGLHMNVHYNTDLYDRNNIARFIEHFKHLLIQVTENPEIALHQQEFLLTEERHLLLHELNDTYADQPGDKTFIDLFTQQALQTPDHTALIFEERSLSYRELDERSNQLARYFKESGGMHEEMLVPICMDRSPEMVIALLSILKVGAAYVPVDPFYPFERIRYMITDTKSALVVTDSQYGSLLNNVPGISLVFVDQAAAHIAALPVDKLPVNPKPGDLAYVIYTSGSTGNPKGVMIEHRSLLNFLCSISALLQLTSTSSIVAVTTYSFDIAYLELYMLLLEGGKVILADRTTATDGFLLTKLLARHSPTHMQATPSTWQMLLDSGWRNTEGVTVLTGGEALKENLKNQLVSLNGQKVWNLYGPTETTIWVTAAELAQQQKVTIGKPIANTQAYILDSNLNLLPAGITGELYIGGVQLARGYLNQEALTGERFISSPFDPGKRLYRTGDLAKRSPDGHIEYIGRIDDQVKIRGFRIEPGEVEHVLLLLDDIISASVQAWEDAGGQKCLVAYIVSNKPQNSASLREQLLSRIPVYMIPVFFVQLETLPLTANGKVDKKALPYPDELAIGTASAYVAPRNGVEEQLVNIWKEVLRTNKEIGVRDNYFELGGESIKAIKILAKVSRQFGVMISIGKMFETPTIENIANEILNRSWFGGDHKNTADLETENIKV